MVNAVAKYQKYAEYKDSGVEWLGEIPSHWNISKVKFLSPFQVGWTPPTKDDSNFFGKNLWVNISDLKARVITDTAKKISDKAASEASMDITPKGSLMYSFKLSVGAVAFAGLDLYTNEAVASFLTTSKLPLSYLYYALPEFVIKNASTNIYGANILNQELIRNANLVAIPYWEAENIANFLDHETAKIDSLIEKQQKLIELLKEKRQAVISHAVTKGLNPDVPMKNSGVEWLGQVPEHWAIIKGGYIGALFGSESIAEEDVVDEGELPFIKVSSLSVENFKLNSIDWFVTEKRAKLCKTEKNYIVFPKRGAAIFANKVNVIDIESVIDPNLMGWKIGRNGLTEYFALLLKVRGLEDIADVSTVPQINNKHIAPEKFTLPPLKEQAEIIAFVSLQLEKFDTLINVAGSAIQIMQERRTALISSAVTGKIDVRSWQNPIPNNNEATTELSP